MTRLTTSGALDSSFDGDGKLAATLTPNGSVLNAVSFHFDGRIAVAGQASNGTNDDIVVAMLDGLAIADYDSVVANWAGTGANLFGACLRAISGAGVSASWAVDADASCTPSDADPWKPVPSSAAGAAAKIATSTTAGTTNATASLRLGIRAAGTQSPGNYSAPVTFEVVAPSV